MSHITIVGSTAKVNPKKLMVQGNVFILRSDILVT